MLLQVQRARGVCAIESSSIKINLGQDSQSDTVSLQESRFFSLEGIYYVTHLDLGLREVRTNQTDYPWIRHCACKYSIFHRDYHLLFS
jgi:hypothetical protein